MGGLLSGRPVRALIIVVPAPSLRLLPSTFEAHAPVLMEAFNLEAPVEGLDAFIALNCFPAKGNNRKTLAKDDQVLRAQSTQ